MVSRQRKANGCDVRDVWKFFPEHGHRRCCCNKPNTNAVVCSVTPLSFVTSKGKCWEVAYLIRFPARMLLMPKTPERSKPLLGLRKYTAGLAIEHDRVEQESFLQQVDL